MDNDKYSLSIESAKKLAALLLSGDSGDFVPDKYDLLAATLFQVTKTMTALQGAMPLSEGEEEESLSLPEVQALVRLSQEVLLTCYKRGLRAQNQALILSERPLLTTVYTVGNVNTISENDSKGVQCFNNVGSEVELNCEIFLQDLVT